MFIYRILLIIGIIYILYTYEGGKRIHLCTKVFECSFAISPLSKIGKRGQLKITASPHTELMDFSALKSISDRNMRLFWVIFFFSSGCYVAVWSNKNTVWFYFTEPGGDEPHFYF